MQVPESYHGREQAFVKHNLLETYLLRRFNSEFLINFMYDFLLRAHSQDLFQDDILEIFGEIPQTNHLTPEEKEECLVSLYSEHLDLVQRRTRAQTKQKKRESQSHQFELFPSAEGVHKENRADPAEVKSYWLNKLTNSPQQFGIEELADMLEETGWFESDFQAAFGDLVSKGKVKNLDATGKRRTKFVHFFENHNKGERLIKVVS